MRQRLCKISWMIHKFRLKILTNIAPIQWPIQSMDSVSIPTGEITANHGFHFQHCKHWVWDQVTLALLLQSLSFTTLGTTDWLIVDRFYCFRASVPCVHFSTAQQRVLCWALSLTSLHKLLIWPPGGAVLTGGTHDDCSVLPKFKWMHFVAFDCSWFFLSPINVHRYVFWFG